MDIILMRHGETEDNLASVFSRDDTPLTEAGVKQVRENAALLKGMEIDEVLVSPLLRAVETYDIVREYVDAPFRIYDGIREIESGIIKGLTFEEASEAYPEEISAWLKDMYQYRLEGGESYLDVYERARDVVEELKATNTKKLLITHSGFINIALAYALGDIKYSSTFKIDYGSITGITFGSPNRIIYANNFVRESAK